MLKSRYTLTVSLIAAAGVLALSEWASADRVMPGDGEVLKVEQVIILSDVTGSTGGGGFELEKRLVQQFVAMIPDMVYQAGFSSFAGGDTEDRWTHVGLRNGTLLELEDAAESYEYIGRSTPLRYAVEKVGGEFRPQAGRSALVVFSDGISKPHSWILDECAAINEAQDGNLCIYTVNIGANAEGTKLLEDMASVTGCGRAWNAADVESPEAMEAMIREIFFAQGSRMVVLSAEVLFDFDKAVLKPEGKRAIDGLIADMNANPGEMVTVEGHTCDIGSNEYNMGLSERRASAVKAYMVDNGIDRKRISTVGYGETQPAVPNTSDANRKLNRRAVFRFSSTM